MSTQVIRRVIEIPSRTEPVIRALTTTDAAYTGLILRTTLAVVIFPHGAQKLLGWFGGFGFSGTMGFFTETMGLSALVALAIIVIEFFGPIALILGAFSRLASVGIAAVMVGAVATTHLPFGFFMNWTGAQGGEGFEYHLLVLGIVAGTLIQGSGAFSIDRLLTRASDERGDHRPGVEPHASQDQLRL